MLHLCKTTFFPTFIICAVLFPTFVFADDFEPADEEGSGANAFVLDADDSGGDITLQFGQTLAEYLRWDSANTYFVLSDDLNVEGNQLLNFRVENLVSAPTCDGTSIGRLYHDTGSVGTFVCDGTTWNQIDASGRGASVDLAAVQARNSTAFVIGTAFADVTFDQTDVENNPGVLAHDNVDTDRITILSDGVYFISYDFSIADPIANNSSVDVAARVQVNDLTVLNGSEGQTTVGERDFIEQELSQSFFASLATNDFVSLQFQRTGNTTGTVANGIFTVYKMEGVSGSEVATDTNTFTLDNDNTGGDVVLQFGATLAETLTWDNTNSEFDLSDDLNVTGNVEATEYCDATGANCFPAGGQVFSAYDNAGNTSLTTTEAVLNLDATRIADTAYALTTDVITLNETAVYKFTAHLTADSFDTTAANRSSIQLRFEDDTSGSFQDVAGTLCQDYMREQANGISSASCSIIFIGSYTAGDQIRLTHQMTGTTTGQTVPQGSGLTIEMIRKS